MRDSALLQNKPWYHHLIPPTPRACEGDPEPVKGSPGAPRLPLPGCSPSPPPCCSLKGLLAPRRESPGLAMLTGGAGVGLMQSFTYPLNHSRYGGYTNKKKYTDR